MKRSMQTRDYVVIGLAIVGAIVLAPVVLGLLGVGLSLLIPVLLWIFSGWAAGKILRGEGYNTLTNLGLGFFGGIIGSALFGLLDIGSGGVIGGIVSGVIGAIALVYLLRFVHNPSFGK